MTDRHEPDCTFCDLLEGRIPATFLHRDERCAAFMDIRPVNPGHVLIIPVAHLPSLAEVPPDDVAHMVRLAQRYAAAIRASGLRCEGVNLFLADGEAAMQEVFHTHLHVFPRYRGDGFQLRFGPHYAIRERAELERAGEMIRNAAAALAE
jgi:histidine triad (HIT) family protein